jgi:hypothetical protein
MMPPKSRFARFGIMPWGNEPQTSALKKGSAAALFLLPNSHAHPTWIAPQQRCCGALLGRFLPRLGLRFGVALFSLAI